MRRLYVQHGFRRRRVANAIASEHLRAVGNEVRIATVRVGDASAAQFWGTLGFQRAASKPWTH
jgi:hypothetical protein